MLTVKTWCLPEGVSEDKLKKLHNAIVGAVASIPETGVKDEGGMLNLFPRDLMNYGSGTVISIEISQVPLMCYCPWLAKAVGSAVKKLFPKARVECEAAHVIKKAGYWLVISEEEQFK